MATNPYYSHTTGQPAASSRGSSLAMRAELDAIAAGFESVYTAINGISASSDFRLIYQGAFALDPVQRYNGSALQNGDLYTNTVAKVLKSYVDGVWYALPTTSTTLLKTGDTMTGPLFGTSASFTGEVAAAGFKGEGKNLTGLTLSQITTALNYTPLNKAGDALTGPLTGTDATFTGTVTGAVIKQSSDERRKKCWKKLPADFLDRVAAIKKLGLYTDKLTGQVRAGAGAQSLAQALPEVVHPNEQGYLEVEYAAAALVIAGELARRREQDMALLTKELAQLRKEVARLKGKK